MTYENPELGSCDIGMPPISDAALIFKALTAYRDVASPEELAQVDRLLTGGESVLPPELEAASRTTIDAITPATELEVQAAGIENDVENRTRFVAFRAAPVAN